MNTSMRRIGTAMLAMLLLAGAARGGEPWKAEKDEKADPKEVFKETRLAAESEIPGMLTAPASPLGDIEAAWYAQPTSRYRHGALGDTIEGGALIVRLKGGVKLTYRLPETEVFEDIAPRIADLDNDGLSEIVTIVSSFKGGASIVIYRVTGGEALLEKAATPHLGAAETWLNIAGIERFFGTQTPEIAFVARPHKDGQLGFLKFIRGRLRLVTTKDGFSNHVFGSGELRLSASADIDGDGRMELALPSRDRRKLRILSLTRKGIVEVASVDLSAPIDKAIVAEGAGKETTFIVGLEDNTIWRIRR
jgi:hypothetical protein